MIGPEEVSIGFEPMKDGFADRSLRPLGYNTLVTVIIYQIRKNNSTLIL